MKAPKLNPQIAAIAILAVLAVGGFIKAMRGEPLPKSEPKPKYRVQIRLLVNEAASPGKVVRAVKNGNVLGSYRCTDQDAAVVWLQEIAPDGLDRSDFSQIFGDKRDLPYCRIDKGELVLLVFARGYAKTPKQVRMEVADGYQARGYKPQTRFIELTHFADPVLALKTPTPSEAVQVESILKANWAKHRFFQFKAVHPTEQELQNRKEFLSVGILSSSYCPEGNTNPDFYSNAQAFFGADAQALKVRVDRYRYEDTTSYLVYKNAQIANVNGTWTLRFPNRQDIGSLLDANAFVTKLVPTPMRGIQHSSFSGDLNIHLVRKLHPEAKYSPKATFASISPSIVALGLDRLKVHIGKQGYFVDLKPNGKKSAPKECTIPELKIGIRISKPVLVSTADLVLPLHHEESWESSFQSHGMIDRSCSIYLPPSPLFQGYLLGAF